MKTVGDVLDEIEKIQKTIRELTPMCDAQDSETLENAICLLANYRMTLRDIPLKK